MSTKVIIELDNVSFSYSCHSVLKNINFTVNPGDAIGITGPNGAGKSTLLKIILGLLKPSSGTVKLFGVNSNRFSSRQLIGYVPQKATSFNQGFPATVLEAVVAGRIASRGLFRPYGSNDYRIAEETICRVGMDHLKHRLMSELSGGQQQLVFVARALVSTPQLLILDEPTVGVDELTQKKLVEILRELNLDDGITLLMVSHEPEIISPIVNRQVCLDKKICHCSCHSQGERSVDDYCKKSIWLYQ